MRYRVLIQQDEDGVFVAEVPSLPGCVSQGKTRDEAVANLREAMAAYVESLEENNEPIVRQSGLTIDQFLDLL
jgi:predicted RNase H-like HicB family nuclease